MGLKSAAVTLILVMDPLGNIPIFLAILSRYAYQRQLQIILREVIIAFFILILFLFAGQNILRAMDISSAALSISGGIILFLIALRMIFPAPARNGGNGGESQQQEEPFVVPLAVPLIAGPSAIATVLLFVTRDPHKMGMWFMAILISSIVFCLVMLCAPFLMRIFGKRGLIAIERLMGMVLTTIAVQMFLTGVSAYISSYK